MGTGTESQAMVESQVKKLPTFMRLWRLVRQVRVLWGGIYLDKLAFDRDRRHSVSVPRHPTVRWTVIVIRSWQINFYSRAIWRAYSQPGLRLPATSYGLLAVLLLA